MEGPRVTRSIVWPGARSACAPVRHGSNPVGLPTARLGQAVRVCRRSTSGLGAPAPALRSGPVRRRGGPCGWRRGWECDAGAGVDARDGRSRVRWSGTDEHRSFGGIDGTGAGRRPACRGDHRCRGRAASSAEVGGGRVPVPGPGRLRRRPGLGWLSGPGHRPTVGGGACGGRRPSGLGSDPARDVEPLQRGLQRGRDRRDTLYSVVTDCTVTALVAATGAVRWSKRLDGECEAAPTVAGGFLYIPTATGYMFALRTTDGSELWRATFSTGSGLGAFSVTSYAAYLSMGNLEVSAFDPATGDVLWKHSGTTFSTEGRTSPVAGGVVYAREPNRPGGLKLDAATGRVLGSFESVRRRRRKRFTPQYQSSQSLDEVLRGAGCALLPVRVPVRNCRDQLRVRLECAGRWVQ